MHTTRMEGSDLAPHSLGTERSILHPGELGGFQMRLCMHPPKKIRSRRTASLRDWQLIQTADSKIPCGGGTHEVYGAHTEERGEGAEGLLQQIPGGAAEVTHG